VRDDKRALSVRGNKTTLRFEKLMLVPCSFTFETDGRGHISRRHITGKHRPTTKFHWKQAVEIGGETTVDNQRQLYSLLSKLEWLPPALSRAVYAEMGITPREYKRRIKEAETYLWRRAIERRKQAMKAEGTRPRGGLHNAAVEEIAPTMLVLASMVHSAERRMGFKVSEEKSRITSEALKQRVRRQNLRARKTGRH